MSKIVLILSGGMDSVTLLYKMLTDGYDIATLTFNYGQKHTKEITASEKTIEYIKDQKFKGKFLSHKTVDISAINDLLKNSALTNENIDVPEGHYTENIMKQTVVPNRNMIFLSLAIGYAVSIEANGVSYAAHSGDHAIYPDCRPEFVDKMKEVAKIADYRKIEIITPFINMTKGEIVKIGIELPVKVDYSKTWTCYKGLEKACGKCGSCVERLEAFDFAGISDPVEYF